MLCRTIILALTDSYDTVVLVSEAFELRLSCHCVRHALLGCLDWAFICKHFIEVTRVPFGGDLWLERSLDLPCSQRSPVNISEEWVRQDVTCVITTNAEALALVAIQQAGEERLGLACEVARHLHWHVHNVVHHLLAVLLVVGRPAAEHLVEDRTLESSYKMSKSSNIECNHKR